MPNCVICQKKLIVQIIVSMLNIKPKVLENDLHISRSLISKYMTGERRCPAIDIYIIEKIFGITVKEYSVNDLFTNK